MTTLDRTWIRSSEPFLPEPGTAREHTLLPRHHTEGDLRVARLQMGAESVHEPGDRPWAMAVVSGCLEYAVGDRLGTAHAGDVLLMPAARPARLATFDGVDALIFAGPDDLAVSERLVPAGWGERLNVLGVPVTIKLSAHASGGWLSAFESEDGLGAGAPPHAHLREDETLFVLEGRYAVTTEEGETQAGPGTLLHFPRGMVHSYRSLTRRGRLLSVTTPGGYESFFRELDRLSRGRPPMPDALDEIARAHGIRLE